MKTVAKCLAVLGVKASSLASCDSVVDEFAAVKKAYFKAALRTHPDKGGDAKAFRTVQTSFEVLRDLYDKGTVASPVCAAGCARCTLPAAPHNQRRPQLWQRRPVPDAPNGHALELLTTIRNDI